MFLKYSFCARARFSNCCRSRRVVRTLIVILAAGCRFLALDMQIVGCHENMHINFQGFFPHTRNKLCWVRQLSRRVLFLLTCKTLHETCDDVGREEKLKMKIYMRKKNIQGREPTITHVCLANATVARGRTGRALTELLVSDCIIIYKRLCAKINNAKAPNCQWQLVKWCLLFVCLLCCGKFCV